MRGRWGRSPVLREALLLLGALWAAALLIAVPVTDGNRLLGSFGDLEQFVWQANRLPDVLHGDWITRDAFLGMPVAFAAVPTTWVHSGLLLLLDGITGNVFYAYNAVLLGLLCTNFVSAYAVARLLGHGRPVALVASGVFALAPNTLMHAQGHAGLPITAAFPWILYAFIRLRDEPAARQWWVLLGVAVGACGFAHEYWLMGGLLTIPLAVALRGRWLLRDRAVLGGAALAVGIAIVMNLPIVWAFAERARLDRSEGVHTSRTAEDGILHAASLPVYVVPSDDNPLWKRFPLPYEHRNHIETLNYLGLANLGVLGVAGGAWVVRRRRRRWAPVGGVRSSPTARAWPDFVALGALGLVLGFGTQMRLNTGLLHLPPELFFAFNIPGYDHLRSWGRYGILVTLVATFASAEIVTRWLRRNPQAPRVLWAGVAITLVLVAVDQQPQWPVATHRFVVPHSIDLVKDTPRDRFVMNLPLGVNDAIHNSTAMMLQVFHGRKIVNGYATGQPLFERRFGAPPLACLAWPPERDHLTDPGCDPEVLGPALDALGVSTIILEHRTPYHDGFTYEDDVALRERTMVLLQGLKRIGWLRTLAVESPYTIFRLSPPPITQLGGTVGGGTATGSGGG